MDSEYRRVKRSKHRSMNGSFMVLTTIVAISIILPLGILAFEIGRLQLAQKQLQVATDSAVLAAAASMRYGKYGPDSTEMARQTALRYLQRNFVVSQTLADAKVSAAVDTSTPKSGDADFDLVYDKDEKQLIAKAALGLEPAFGRFLGVGAQTIRAHSKAAANKQPIDVVIVFDVSGSMGFAGGGEPLISAKQSLNEFLDDFRSKTAKNHFGLVTYSTVVSGDDGAGLPHVELSTSDENVEQIKTAMAPITPQEATNTGDALAKGLAMVNGGAHRKGAEKIIILISDGLPNRGQDPLAVARLAAQNNIPLHSIGFFHTPEAMSDGRVFLQQLKAAAGGDSESYTASTISEFRTCLHHLCNNMTTLVN